MERDRGSSGRRWAAGLFAALAAVAMAVLVSSQLSLMSVLNEQRAEDAATKVAESRFTSDLIERTVRSAVSPVTDDSTATLVATTTSENQVVKDMIRGALVSAHHQVVDPDSVPADSSTTATDASVRSAIAQALVEAGVSAGVDLRGVADQVESPSVVPDKVPTIGLRPMAELSRGIAALVVVLAGFAAIVIHPRPGRGLAGLGWKFAIVFGAWFVSLVVIGWVIDTIAETLFGELLQSIWSDAAPAMLLLCGAGLLLCAALWFGGVALDGLVSRRSRYAAAPPAAADHSYWA